MSQKVRRNLMDFLNDWVKMNSTDWLNWSLNLRQLSNHLRRLIHLDLSLWCVYLMANLFERVNLFGFVNLFVSLYQNDLMNL